MKQARGLFGLIICAIAVLFIDKNGFSIGDTLLGKLGVNPWSGAGKTGLHISLVIALLFLILGYSVANQFYKKKYPKFSRWFFYFIVLAVILTSTEWG